MAFQKMTASLEEMEGRKKALEEAIAGLQDRYDTKRSVLRSETGKVREASEEELATIATRLSDERSVLLATQNDLKDKEQQAIKRALELDAEIETKTNDLERIKKGFEDFQRQHGLL